MVVRNNRGILGRLRTIFENQKSRGEEGAGMSVLHTEKGILRRVRKLTPQQILRSKHFNKVRRGDLILFHHRLPTSTPNLKQCNHPICNEDETIHLIHNGWILDYEEQYSRLKAEGHLFETEVIDENIYKYGSKSYVYRTDAKITDSEVIVHLVEKYAGNGMYIDAIEKVVKATCGTFAFAFLVKGHDKIYLYNGRQGIHVYKDSKNNIYFSSQYPSKKGFSHIRKLGYGEIGELDFFGYRKVGMVQECKISNYQHNAPPRYNFSEEYQSRLIVDSELDGRNGAFTRELKIDQRSKRQVFSEIVGFSRANSHMFNLGFYELRELIRAEFFNAGYMISEGEVLELEEKLRRILEW